MNEEFQGFFGVFGAEGAVLDPGRVVCDGADDAASFAAVAGQVDGAGLWGVVFGVDEAGSRYKYQSCAFLFDGREGKEKSGREERTGRAR